METLNKHFRNLAQAAFTRHGFASEQLISQWDAVIGQPYASHCVPEKINWPRSASDESRKMGGTLYLRVNAGRGLELHYEIPRLIERVNQFLGYGAIAAIKIVQSTHEAKPEKPAPKPIHPDVTKAWAENIDDIADDGLKAALARLATHAAPNGPKTSLSTGENRDWSKPTTSSRKTL
jgi:hypothetical protein